MSIAIAARIARRELRGGIRDFRVFLLCLSLGIAAIAGVGSVRTGIEQGLRDQGATILGGDAAMEFVYRYATPAEVAWQKSHALKVSQVVKFRSMAVVGQGDNSQRALTEVKAVDSIYPIYGRVRLSPDMALATAFAAKNGVPGAIIGKLLADRLGLSLGDRFRLGTQTFRLSAILRKEPDNASNIGFAPRTIVRADDLKGSGLLGAGTIFDSYYRMKLPPGTDLAALKKTATRLFGDNGMRWHDKRNGAPGIELFVRRIASFLVLVGLAGLAVGGIGVSSAVRSYLETKTEVIATLKTLGAEASTIFWVYFLQIGALSILGITLGLLLGAALPYAFAPLIAARLPLPADFSLHWRPLAEAASYGILTALLFTLWPIARTEKIRPAALFRDAVSRSGFWPRPVYIVLTALVLAGLVAVALAYAAVPILAIWTFVGILAALLVLSLAVLLVKAAARHLAQARMMRGRTALRLALGAVGGPNSEASSVILSLGLGLSVLAAIGQIDANLRGAIADRLPDIAPSFFFVDIQPDQLAGFLARTKGDPQVSRVDTVPMLRGVISRINGRPARQVVGDSWVVSGDRGVTYADAMPAKTVLTRGKWWPVGYDGPPQVSFADKQARELGLKLGDMITVNILGRDINARITSFRVVDFSTAGIGFVLLLDANALKGAPHTNIATVYAAEPAEAPLLRDLGNRYPNITAIRVKDAIAQVVTALGSLAAATSYAALATLITGFVVLIGAAAAGERAREYEAAILKTIGMTRRGILLSFALRSAILGAAAGLVAIGAGSAAGWAIMRFVMESPYRFEPLSAFLIVFGGAAVTLAAGMFFTWRPLAARPAAILRARE